MRICKKFFITALTLLFACGLSFATDFSFGAKKASADEGNVGKTLKEEASIYSILSPATPALRLSAPYEVQVDTSWYSNMTAYLGISEDGEGIDLSSVDSFKFYLRGITTGNAWTRVMLLDKNGGTAVSSVTSGEAFFYSYDGTDVSSQVVTNAWQGYKTSGQDGYLQTARDKFQNKPSLAWGSEGKTFDWTAVTTVAVYCNTYNANIVDVGDVVAVTGMTETTLFDVSEATKAETAKVKSNEYFFGPTAGNLTTFYNNGCNFTVAAKSGLNPSTVEITCTHYASNDITLTREASSKDVWLGFSSRGCNGDKLKTNDYSDYSALAFDVDASGARKSGRLDLVLRIGTEDDYKEYRGKGNKVFAYFVTEEGEILQSASLGYGCNVIPAGFKGTFVVPYGAFERDTDGGTVYLTAEDMKECYFKSFVFVADSFDVGDTLKLNNVRLIDEYEDRTQILAVQYKVAAIPSEITKGNYLSTKALLETVEEDYNDLDEAYRALVADYGRVAETKAGLENKGVEIVNDELASLPTVITSENYQSVKDQYSFIETLYDGLSEDGQERVENYDKLDKVLDAFDVYNASFVITEIEGIEENVTADNLQTVKNALEKAEASFDALSASAQKKVTNAEKIETVWGKVYTYEAADVIELLDSLPSKVNKNNYEQTKIDFKEAQDMYEALSKGAREKVANVSKFATTASAIEAYENRSPVSPIAVIAAIAGAVLAVGSVSIAVVMRKKRVSSEK